MAASVTIPVLHLSLVGLLAHHQGPVLLWQQGRVLAANHQGEALAGALLLDEQPTLLLRMQEAVAIRQIRHDKVELPAAPAVTADEGGPPPFYHLTILPLEQPEQAVLLLGREATLERSLTRALLASRELFKDLVTCSTDFAWETRADGRFGFVSPRGALGYAAEALEGQPSRVLASKRQKDSSQWPFTSRVTLDSAEVWLQAKDGALSCFEISALPVFAGDGGFLGVRGVARDVTAARQKDAQLRQALATVEQLSQLDELTGLLNRRAFMARLASRLAAGQTGALLYCDLDHFKAINDTRGHAAGDALLQVLAGLLRKLCRPDDLLARLGGDEFAIWLHEAPLTGAQAKAAAIVAAIQALDATHGVPGKPLAASAGISLPQPGSTPDQLLAQADAAMYRAKRAGRGQVMVADTAA